MKKILEEICKEECDKGYCIIREMISHSGISDRQAIQFKMVEIHKFNLSKPLNKDVGWQEAWNDWVKNYASKFAEVFDNDNQKYYTEPGLKYKQLYEAITK